MHRKRIIATLLLLTAALHAQADSCPSMPASVTDVNRDWIVDMEAKIGMLGKVRAGDFKATVKSIAKTITETIPDSGRVYVTQMLASMGCQSIMTNKTLSEKERNEQIKELNRTLAAFYNNRQPASTATQPAPAATEKKQGCADTKGVIMFRTPARKNSGSTENLCQSNVAAFLGISEEQRLLDKNPPSHDSFKTQVADAMRSVIEEQGMTVVGMQEFDYTGNADTFRTPLDTAKKCNAGILVAADLSIKERPLNSPFIEGKVEPLRTVDLNLHLWVSDTGSRKIVARGTTRAYTIAAFSTQDAVDSFTSDESFLNSIGNTMKQMCSK